MAQLSGTELRKYSTRPEIFIRKLNEKSPFEVKGGKKVIILTVGKDVEKTLRTGSVADLNALRFGDNKGNIYKLTDFVKTKEFGGKGAGSGTAKEDAALMDLRNQIQATLMKNGVAQIRVKIGSHFYNVADVVTTPGTPKSDFHLVDTDGNEVAWISHKDGSKAKDFQQWGGLSATKEPLLASHKETESFVADIKKTYPNGLPNATTITRKIKDNKLKMMSVYGNEYGKKFSRQNVTLMLQGDVKLNKFGNFYTITATHTHVNGDVMDGDYEPVFMAIYKGDRSDFGVRGTRIVIAPAKCRKVTGEI